MLAAFALKRFYSRASAEDLAWILVPMARAVGWLRGETLTLSPDIGWVAPDGSYHIAPACAGLNFLILVLTVSVLGFAHRLRTPGERLAWWLASLAAAWVLTLAVNTLRILAAVELYRLDPATGLTPEQMHRILGIVIYLGALWGLFGALDKLTSPRREGSYPILVAAVLVPGAYLGITVVGPWLNGAWRHQGGAYAEHAMMVTLVTLASGVAMALLAWVRTSKRGGERRP
ncbi:MAG TPA: exosortase K [Thermoanaerobaculia bacterium]|nr:exosortase K [Thermoanaerobaculia bacterium]